MKIITGAANIEKSIKSIATRGAKFANDVHVSAVSCLAHIAEHGDVTLLTRLYKALPKGTKANALIAWAEVHGPVKWDAKAEDKAAGSKGVFTFVRGGETLLDEAKKVSPFDFKAPATESEFDLAKKCVALAKAATGEDLSDAEIMAAMKTALLEVRAAAAAKGKSNVVQLKAA